METLALVVRWEISLLLAGLSSLVGYQMLTGRIRTAGLLSDKGENRRFSPGRAQLLVLTVNGALFYLVQTLSQPTQFPEIPQELLWVFGGSHALYLGGKSAPLVRSLLHDTDWR